jgi:ABC-type sugar transport system permease subunit
MTLYFLPFVVPGVVSALVFSLLFNQYGLINSILGTRIAWLHDESVAMVALSATTIWAMTGYYVVIFMAGYQQVPEELLDAAKIDGANAWKQFRYVEVPSLTPTILFATISASAAVMTDFGTPFILNQGGPNYATTTLPLYIYNQTFQYSSAGYGEAISTVLLVISLLLTLIQVVFITGTNRRAR